MPGAHNVANAAAALTACVIAGAQARDVAGTLADFGGAGRRFERLGETASGALVVDDYAHHPTELRATIAAARTLGHRRVVAVFQPHLFSRTQLLAREFGAALSEADVACVLDVYPSRERAEDFPGVSGLLVAEAAADAAPGHPVAWARDFADAERLHARRRCAQAISASCSVPATSTSSAAGLSNTQSRLEVQSGRRTIRLKLSLMAESPGVADEHRLGSELHPEHLLDAPGDLAGERDELRRRSRSAVAERERCAWRRSRCRSGSPYPRAKPARSMSHAADVFIDARLDRPGRSERTPSAELLGRTLREGVEVARAQGRIREERARADGVGVGRIEHHALAAPQREDGLAHVGDAVRARRSRCPSRAASSA